MTESIKLTAEDIHIVSTVVGYAVKFRSLEGLDIIWNEKQAKELKQQILENQEIVNDISEIVKRRPHSNEDKTIIKVLREILSENKNLDFDWEPKID